MIKVISQANSVQIGEGEYPKNSLSVHVKGDGVEIRRAGDGSIVIGAIRFSEYMDNTGVPYASMSGLTTALRAAIFVA